MKQIIKVYMKSVTFATLWEHSDDSVRVHVIISAEKRHFLHVIPIMMHYVEMCILCVESEGDKD